MGDSDNKYWVALKWIDGVGNIGMRRLVDACGSAKQVFSASPEQLKAVEGISSKIITRIDTFDDWDRVDRELELAAKRQAAIIHYKDPLYPPGLLHIYDFPPLLYVKGNIDPSDVYIAVVGSRMASNYGRYTTEKLCREMGMKGINVVSGMARGIDSAAHRGALAGKGRTVAVLGCGLDIVYPPENADLMEEIASHGAVITEFPLGTLPNGPNFPARNRIISGMSLGVVVVEASDKSGSLITARMALEQGREVFAVPGSIDTSGSKGTNRLIKEGAKLVEGVDDILEELEPHLSQRPKSPLRETAGDKAEQAKKKSTPPGDNLADESERVLYRLISATPIDADSLIAASGLKTADTLTTLMRLELKGCIKQLAGKTFIRKE